MYFIYSDLGYGGSAKYVGPPISDGERILLSDIITYLDNVVTLKAKFIETTIKANNGTKEVRTGRIWLWRPGRARVEYDMAITDLPSTMLTNGIYVYVYSEKSGENHWDLDQTPLAVILQKPITLGTDITLTKLDISGNNLGVTIIAEAGTVKGGLRLYFTKKPLELIGWMIPDPRGSATTISLSDIQMGLLLDQKLFEPIFPPVKHD